MFGAGIFAVKRWFTKMAGRMDAAGGAPERELLEQPR